MEPSELKNAPAIVVTGASSGIGREIARVAARDGQFLLLIGRSEAALTALAAELRLTGARCAHLIVDLQQAGSARLIEAELERLGLDCDVLVNSAGYGLFGPAASLPVQDQLGVVAVNVCGLTELTLRFLPGMMARGRGGVLNVSSISGFAPGPYLAVYFASKAFVTSFSKSLAAETAGRGVTVTCLIPGFVRTAFFDRCGVGTTRLSKLAPRMDADRVAREGWQGFRKGKRQVIPGLANRFMVAVLRLTPEPVLLALTRVLQSPR